MFCGVVLCVVLWCCLQSMLILVEIKSCNGSGLWKEWSCRRKRRRARGGELPFLYESKPLPHCPFSPRRNRYVREKVN
ncbi:hypothetical protein ACQKWADRAFT_302934 [Trichoderma austrokoningii]